MSAALIAPNRFAEDTAGAVVELRREAVSAVARQQQLREELSAVSRQAREIEHEASRALARGEDLLARQILARGLLTLKTRDALEAELALSRTRVTGLLATMVRAEDRALGQVCSEKGVKSVCRSK
jgi:phage shock protein A